MRAFDERRAWEQLSGVAARQHGVVTTRQVLRHFHRRQAQRRVQRGLLVRTAAGVWRIPSHSSTWEQELMVCILAGGPRTVASHTSAGRLWRLQGVEPGTIHVTVPRNRDRGWVGRRRQGRFPVVVHRPTAEVRTIVREGSFRITTVARTIVDMATVLDTHALAEVIDDALRRRMVTLDQIRAERAQRPMRGASRLDLIIERRSESGVGESKWEDLLRRWIVAAGLPVPVRQFEIQLPGGLARLDFAYPQFQIAVEFDGFEWHNTRRRFDRDRVRTSELTVAGWAVILITSSLGREEAVDIIRRALLSRGWQSAE